MYCISDQERGAMYGLPHRCRVLYHELRAWMDVETRLTGVRRGISWQSLREALFVEPHQGDPDSGSPSKDQVRRMASRLERAGLLEAKSVDKRLIFFLPLADTHHSAQKKAATKPPQSRHTQPATEPDTPEPHGNAGFGEQADTQATTKPPYPEEQKAATPQESRIKGREREKPISVISPSADGAEVEPGTFAEFWSVYPKKVGKKPASEKWKAKGLNRIGSAIVADVQERASKDRKWLDGYVPNPATYLTQERWNDEIEVAASQESHAEKVKRQLRESSMGAGQVIEGRWSNG